MTTAENYWIEWRFEPARWFRRARIVAHDRGTGDIVVATLSGSKREARVNARRIIACLAKCAGAHTHQLEDCEYNLQLRSIFTGQIADDRRHVPPRLREVS